MKTADGPAKIVVLGDFLSAGLYFRPPPHFQHNWKNP